MKFPTGQAAPSLDLTAIKTAVLDRLDFAAEYAALGVKFTKSRANSKGWRECRAFGREDNDPSASVELKTGRYTSFGDGAESLSFFDFAVKYGQLGDFMDVLRHYAGKTGVAISPGTRQVKDGWSTTISNGPPRKGFSTFDDAVADQARNLKGKPAGHWIYADDSGKEVFRVVRFDVSGKKGKTYRPFHFNPSAGWVCSDPEGPLPLYNLTKLAGAARVYVAEGEKCAERGEVIGLTFTTSAHGSGSVPKSDWGPLAGKDVVILPDHDKPGEAFAQDVVAQLTKLDPRPRVRVVRLPVANNGDDIVDWLESVPDGWNPEECRAELERLAGLVEPVDFDTQKPVTETSNGDGNGWKLDVQPASSVKIRPVRYLAKPFLPRGMIVLLAGLGGEGKSLLLLQILASLSSGSPCFGLKDSELGPIDVLLLANEDGYEDTAAPRLIAAGANMDRVDIVKGLVNSKGDRTPFDISHVDYLRRYVEEGRAAGKKHHVVGIDPITTYVGRAKIDDHRDAQLKPALEGLAMMAQELDITFLCVAHLNKGSGGKAAIYRIMGGSSYVTSSRLVYLYGADPDDESRRILASPKCNLPEKPPALAVKVERFDQDEALKLLAPHVSHLDEAERLELASQLRRLRFDGGSNLTADEVVNGGKEGRQPSRKDDAIRFLKVILDGGKYLDSNTVYSEGKKAGLSRNALWEAKEELEIKARKEGGKWHWAIPVPDPEPPIDFTAF
jgi:hypothetical protein